MASHVTAVLLLSCRDQKGLVTKVSEFVFRHGGNILHADQHMDRETGLFLQRIEWELSEFGLGREQIAEAFREVAEPLGMSFSLRFSDHMPRVALFASRLPHCVLDLLARWRTGELRCEIPYVFGNHEELRSLIEPFGVPYQSLDINPETKSHAERRILQLLDQQRIELVVLARYMQILGPELVGTYERRIINIHHSFLPAFAGGRPYHQAYARGVKVIGATAHYVTTQLDEGPIIAQDVAPVGHRDSIDELVRKGRDLEKVVLGRAVSLHLANRILVYGNRTVVFD